MKKNKGMRMAMLCLLLMLCLLPVGAGAATVTGADGAFAWNTEMTQLTVTGEAVVDTDGEAFDILVNAPDDEYVEIQGTVTGTLTMEGGRASVEGYVDGDVLVKGGMASVKGYVDGDVLVNGGEGSFGSVSGSVTVEGGVATLQGAVTRGVTVNSGIASFWSDENSVQADVTVNGGKVFFECGLIGELTVTGGKVEFTGSRGTNLVGSLHVSGGKVLMDREYISDGEAYGAKLTGNSWITGGEVVLAGGHNEAGGAPALSRTGSETLSVSRNASLTLKAGVYGTDESSGRPTFDHENLAPAIEVGEEAMLVWDEPMQMAASDYNGSMENYKNRIPVDNTKDANKLKGKHVIQSVKRWYVIYDANGCTSTVDTEIVNDGEPYNVKTDVFIQSAHHSFLNQTVTMGGIEQKENRFPVTADVLVKANWKEDAKYTIAFDTDGGNAIDPIVDYAGEAVAKPADPTKEGYTFAGWDTAIPETMPEKNLTIKATWTKNQYTIKFEDEDGNKLGEFTGGYGDPITPPADPTKEGYSFAGWDTAIPETMPAKDLTIKATWTENEDNLDDPENPETLYRAGQYGIDRANLGSLPYKTAAELKDALRKVMINEGFIADGEEFFDVVLEESLDGGVTWDEVPADEFPAEGYRVVFKYPQGTNKDAFIFKVVHMFAATDTRLNITAGGTETPDVQLTDEGIVVTLKGFSPVMLQWQKKPSAAAMPQTGDPSSLLGWTMLLGASGFGAKMLKRKKK